MVEKDRCPSIVSKENENYQPSIPKSVKVGVRDAEIDRYIITFWTKKLDGFILPVESQALSENLHAQNAISEHKKVDQ
jgi:hypothetical protein